MRQNPIFVVGTGRCGSTLLSNIFSLNTSILSISEFFVSLSPFAFNNKYLDGNKFWEILSSPRPKATLMLKQGIGIPEFLYTSNEGVPPILLMTLPHISDEADLLFKEVEQFVLGLPINHLSAQYILLFEWLRNRFNKSIWIERSGGSLRFIPQLRELFPDAKFIHLYRDGRETAMSMSRHNAFRLTIIQAMIKQRIGKDPFYEIIVEEERKQLGELAYCLPDSFDKRIYKNIDIPIERYGTLWSSQVLLGIQNLSRIPKVNVFNLRYEELLANPEICLSELMTFIESSFDDTGFIKTAARLVQTDKKMTWIDLEKDDQDKLTLSCKPGLRLLNYL